MNQQPPPPPPNRSIYSKLCYFVLIVVLYDSVLWSFPVKEDMEGQKRKRGDDSEMDGKRAKGEEVNGGQTTVTEDEVEEFFAILRRIHVAVKYFEKGNGEGRRLTGKRWRPCFELEDFEADNGVKDGVKREEENSGLDLNSDPAS